MNRQQIAESLLFIARANLAYLEPDVDLEDEDNEDLWIPVRLRCHRDDFDPKLRALPSGHYYRDGNTDPDDVHIEILSGDSQYDTDHRGWWGNDCIHVTADMEAALEVASDLMDGVEEQISMDGLTSTKTTEEVKTTFKPSQFGIAPSYAWHESGESKHLCFVTVQDGEWWFPSVSGLSY